MGPGRDVSGSFGGSLWRVRWVQRGGCVRQFRSGTILGGCFLLMVLASHLWNLLDI